MVKNTNVDQHDSPLPLNNNGNNNNKLQQHKISGAIEKKYVQKIALQLNRAQKTIAAHRKCALALRKLHVQDANLFLQHFFHMIRPILLIFKREPNVERLIQFIIQYASNVERIASTNVQHKMENGDENLENLERLSDENDEIPNFQNHDCPIRMSSDDGSDDVIQKFCFDMMRHLIRYAHAKDKAIRFRVCQIVAGLINLMPEEVEIDDDLCEQLLDTFVCRLRDKIPAVRQQAVCILTRIHDPLNPEDRITNEYKRLMSTDTNKDVRKEVIKCIVPSKFTLSSIVERTRDVKDDVRRAAYEKLFTSCPFKRLSILERVSILKNGLRDRSKAVQEACVSLLAQQWLGVQVENDIIALLKALDVENYTETAELALNCLFDLNDAELKKHIMGKTIDINQLTPESVLYLRMKIQYLIREGREDDLEEVLPNATEFCAITANHYKECHEFTTKQCLIIAKHLDFCDEVGRKNIHIILKHMVMVFQQPENHITEIVEALRIVVPSEPEFRATIRECVEPLQALAVELEASTAAEEEERKLQKSEIEANIKKCKSKLQRLEKDKKRLEVELEELDEDEDESETMDEIQEDLQKVIDRIEELKEAIEELKEDLSSADTLKKDAMVWIRTLCVLKEVNKVVSPQCVQKLLEESSILKSIVVPCLTKKSPHVRCFAMTVLGQYCGMHLPFAQKYVNLFTNSLNDRKEDPMIHRAALAASFDMVQIHSFGSIYERCEMDEKETCISELVATFKELMFESVHADIAITAIEGCCKLIIFNKLQEHHVLEILSNMIIVLFNPDTEKFVQVKQCLSMFLPAFSFSTLKNMNRVAKIVLPTLLRISQMSNINLQQAGQFLIYLTDRTHLKKAPKDLSFVQPHCQVAIQLAYEVLVNNGSKESNTFCKLFSNFAEFDDETSAKQLYAVLKLAEPDIPNRISAKAIEKYLELLQVNLDKFEKKNKKQQEGTTKDEEEEDVEMETRKEDDIANDQLEQLIEMEKEEHVEFRDAFMQALFDEDALTACFFALAGVPQQQSQPEPQEQQPVETAPVDAAAVTQEEEDLPTMLSDGSSDNMSTPSKTPTRSPASLPRTIPDNGPNGPNQSLSPAFSPSTAALTAATTTVTAMATPVKTPTTLSKATPRRVSIMITPIKTPSKYNDDDLILNNDDDDDEDGGQIQYSPRLASIARRLSCAATQQKRAKNEDNDDDVVLGVNHTKHDDSDSEVEALDLDDISSDEEDDEDMAMPMTPSNRRLTILNRELDSLIDEVPLNDDDDATMGE